MLNLYRRHQPPCRYASRRYRNCTCSIWVQGSLRGELQGIRCYPYFSATANGRR